MSDTVTPAQAPRPPAIAGFNPKAFSGSLRDYGMILCLVGIVIFFQFFTDGALLRPLNLTNLVLQNSYIVVMALGMLLVIVAGHIDLSVGSTAGFIGALAAVLMVQMGLHPLLATVLCLVAGGIIGAAQGWWVAYLRIPSFIVTLAGMLVFTGLTLAPASSRTSSPAARCGSPRSSSASRSR
jgi:putative multiple sugar transport system permease protein